MDNPSNLQDPEKLVYDVSHSIAVIGAGTMGNGIAHAFAQAGFKVNLVDVSEVQLEKAIKTIEKNLNRQVEKAVLTEDKKRAALENISTFTDLIEGVKNTNLVIEAASENIDLKLKIFSQMDEAAPKGCVLATNTSSISITRIAAATTRPELVIGMHFMNPVPVMKLVEIINGYATSPTVTISIVALSKQLGKIPCVVNDYPGFIANRILMPMINEAIYSLYESIAGVEEIDTVMKLGMAHPMGPLQLADFSDIKAWQQGENIAVRWTVENELNVQRYEVEKSTDGSNFTKVNSQAATNTNGALTYNWLDKEALTGDNFYRIRSVDINGKIAYSKVVQVKLNKITGGIIVYPNPVTGKVVGLQLYNMAAGKYHVRLLNKLGQVLLVKSFFHAGGGIATEKIRLSNEVVKGIYTLEITTPDESKAVIRALIQ